MPDIFLYVSAPNPSDIILSDPTKQRSGQYSQSLVASMAALSATLTWIHNHVSSGSLDILFDIQMAQVGANAWDVTMVSQPGSLAAQRMGGASVTQRFYGNQRSALGQARLFMMHNGIGS